MSQDATKAVQADKAANRQPTRLRDGEQTSPAASLLEFVGLLQGRAGNGAVTRLLGGGAPLAADVREEMEERFGTGFADVRIHNDARSEASAMALGANAYTHGSDIVFSQGRFASGSLEGKQLLAHELAHVVQQRRGGAVARPIPDARGSPLEVDADRAAESAVSAGGPVEVTGASAPSIALQPSHTKQTPDPQTPERISKESTAQDPAEAAREMFEAVESMTYLGQAGRYSIEVGGQLYEIDERHYQHNLSNARKAIRGLVNAIRDGANDIEHSLAAIRETNRKWPYVPVAEATEYFYDVEAPGDELTIPLDYAIEAEAALARNDFSIAFEQIELGHAAMLDADKAVEAYRQELVENSTLLFEAIDSYRKAFNNVLIGIGAVLLAPEVLTVGAVATIIGGAGVVGGATEGAMDLTQQAIKGEGIDPQQTLQETTAGTTGAVVSATAGLVTGGTARWFGPGATAPQTAGRMGLAGSAGGAVGGGLGATVEGKPAGDVAYEALLGATEGFLGGLAGGATTHLTGGLRLPSRMAVGAVAGGASSGAAAWAVGRSPEQIALSIFAGGAAGGVGAGIETPGARQVSPEESIAPRSRPTRSGQRPLWEEAGQDVDFGIKVFRSGDVLVGRHPNYPETIFLLQPEGLPKVFTRLPDGTITEVPWPFSKRLTTGPDPSRPPPPSIAELGDAQHRSGKAEIAGSGGVTAAPPAVPAESPPSSKAVTVSPQAQPLATADELTPTVGEASTPGDIVTLRPLEPRLRQLESIPLATDLDAVRVKETARIRELAELDPARAISAFEELELAILKEISTEPDPSSPETQAAAIPIDEVDVMRRTGTDDVEILDFTPAPDVQVPSAMARPRKHRGKRKGAGASTSEPRVGSQSTSTGDKAITHSGAADTTTSHREEPATPESSGASLRVAGAELNDDRGLWQILVDDGVADTVHEYQGYTAYFHGTSREEAAALASSQLGELTPNKRMDFANSLRDAYVWGKYHNAKNPRTAAELPDVLVVIIGRESENRLKARNAALNKSTSGETKTKKIFDENMLRPDELRTPELQAAFPGGAQEIRYHDPTALETELSDLFVLRVVNGKWTVVSK